MEVVIALHREINLEAAASLWALLETNSSTNGKMNVTVAGEKQQLQLPNKMATKQPNGRTMVETVATTQILIRQDRMQRQQQHLIALRNQNPEVDQFQLPIHRGALGREVSIARLDILQIQPCKW